MHIFVAQLFCNYEHHLCNPGRLVVTQGLCHDLSEPKSAEEAASSHTPAFPVLLPLSWVPLSLCSGRMDMCSLRLVLGFCGLFVVFVQEAQEKDWHAQAASNKHEEFYRESTSGAEGTVMCFSPLLFLGLRVLGGYWFSSTAILSSCVNYL